MQPEKILIVAPAWIGDMVIAQSLFINLKRQRPEAQIDVLAPIWTLPLLSAMPQINESIIAPWSSGELRLAERRQLGKTLGKKDYTQAIVLPNSMKSALAPLFAKIPRRTGWRGEWRYGALNDMRFVSEDDMPLLAQRFVALGQPPDAPPVKPPNPSLRVERDQAVKSAHNYGLKLTWPALALCPGAAYGPAKRWPIKHFVEVAKKRAQEGWQIWIFGGKEDERAGREIVERCRDQAGAPCVNLCAKPPLADSIHLISLANQAVSNDSGLMHVAAALNVPLVALFGSTSPRKTPPMSDKARVLRLDLSCSPCFQRRCPLGHTDCLNKLSPQSVLATLNKLPTASSL